MGKRGARKPKKVVGDPNDPEGLYCWMLRYLEALRIKNFSGRTVENRESYLGFFIEWCEARSITRPQEVTKPIIDRYQRHLFHLRKPSGKPLSFSAQIARLVPVRGFFKWLTRQNVLLWNPASEIELPKQEKRLPKHVLTADEAEAVMLLPNVADPIGLRDRAILETFYSTGIRRMEVILRRRLRRDPFWAGAEIHPSTKQRGLGGGIVIQGRDAGQRRVVVTRARREPEREGDGWGAAPRRRRAEAAAGRGGGGPRRRGGRARSTGRAARRRGASRHVAWRGRRRRAGGSWGRRCRRGWRAWRGGRGWRRRGWRRRGTCPRR
jgi:hypothetical protein